MRLSVERSNRSRLRRGPCTFLAHDQTRFTTWLCLGHQAFCQTKFWPGREAFRARASYQAFDSSSAQILDFPISQGLFRSVRPPSGGQTQFLGQTNGPTVCHLAQKLGLCLCAPKGGTLRPLFSRFTTRDWVVVAEATLRPLQKFPFREVTLISVFCSIAPQTPRWSCSCYARSAQTFSLL